MNTPCAIDAREKIAHGELMARNDPMMRFRAPEELRARLEAAAAESHRSLNAEIVQRLEQSFLNDSFIKQDADMARVNFTLGLDLWEWKKEIFEQTERDPNATDIEKAIAAHEFDKAEKHMRFMLANARIEDALAAEIAQRKLEPEED